MLELGKILENRPVAKDIYEMVLEAPKIAKAARPGQFVNLRLSDKLDPLLRRPIRESESPPYIPYILWPKPLQKQEKP